MFDGVLEDAVGMTDAELDAEVRALELQQRRLDARRGAVYAVAANRGAFRADGHRSVNGYLRATCNTSNGTIRTQLKLARLVDAHPAVGEALLLGRISTDHALQLERVHANPRTSHLLGLIVNAYVELAEHSSVREFTGEIDTVIHFADQDGAFNDLADSIDGRTATVTDVDGALFVRASGGDPVECAQMVAVFESFVDGEYQNDLAARREQFGDDADQHPLARTARQRRFDALRAIFAAAAGSPQASNLPDPEVGIIIDDDTTQNTFATAGVTLANGNHPDIAADQDPDDNTANTDKVADAIDALAEELTADPEAFRRRKCETSTGSKIHPIIALRWLLTAHIHRVIINSKGVVIDYGERKRLFTGLARQAALLLADTCDFPGCELPARWCEIDHRHEHHQGGPTDQANAGIECDPHNRHKHRAGLTVRRDNRGKPYHLKPDGTIILPVGERPPDLTDDESAEHIRQRLAALQQDVA